VAVRPRGCQPGEGGQRRSCSPYVWISSVRPAMAIIQEPFRRGKQEMRSPVQSAIISVFVKAAMSSPGAVSRACRPAVHGGCSPGRGITPGDIRTTCP
jgi:hypothetical protein